MRLWISLGDTPAPFIFRGGECEGKWTCQVYLHLGELEVSHKFCVVSVILFFWPRYSARTVHSGGNFLRSKHNINNGFNLALKQMNKHLDKMRPWKSFNRYDPALPGNFRVRFRSQDLQARDSNIFATATPKHLNREDAKHSTTTRSPVKPSST